MTAAVLCDTLCGSPEETLGQGEPSKSKGDMKRASSWLEMFFHLLDLRSIQSYSGIRSVFFFMFSSVVGKL